MYGGWYHQPLTEETIIENGKILVPVRDMAEVMGGRVNWDKETYSVNIQTGVNRHEQMNTPLEASEQKERKKCHISTCR
ncbi:stalk domain-containing protein [Paenibacillus tarimensis]|uniref:stalk domain-containing protein n=1 Tax=Paenibacillus tarimensis TaxID=416012 RepID=UPI0038B37BEE